MAQLSGEGKPDNPYLIRDSVDMQLLHNIAYICGHSYFKVTNDIDMKQSEWMPLGTAQTPCDVSIDGQGHTIYNLSNVFIGIAVGECTVNNLNFVEVNNG